MNKGKECSLGKPCETIRVVPVLLPFLHQVYECNHNGDKWRTR